MKTKTLLATLTIACLAITSHATPAAADNPANEPGEQRLIHSMLDESYCFDASLDPAKQGHVVYLFKCHGRENQRWTLARNEDGTTSIIGLEGKCLDVKGARVKDETPLQLFPCHYRANQRFNLTPSGRIKEVQSGKCLTVSGAGDRKALFIDECDEQVKKQTWHVSTSV